MNAMRLGPKGDRKAERRRLASDRRNNLAIATITHRDGTVAYRYDFEARGLPLGIAIPIAEAFEKHYVSLSINSVRSGWNTLRQFVRFVSETKQMSDLSMITDQSVAKLIEWLQAQVGRNGKPWTIGTQAGVYTLVKNLIRWLQRHRPELGIKAVWPANPFPLRHSSSKCKTVLPSLQIRKILRACEKDIDLYWRRFETGKNWIADGRATWKDDTPRTLRDLVVRVAILNDGCVPMLPGRKVHSKNKDRSKELGRTRYGLENIANSELLQSYLSATRHSAFAYYLAILIHTGGNPGAIAGLSIDCVEPIPLVDDHATIAWAKARAGSIQRVAFSTRKRFHPPTLISQMKELAQPLRRHTNPKFGNDLFLYRTYGAVVAFRNWSRSDTLKSDFIRRHQLEYFSLDQIRASLLTIHYEKHSDIKSTQAFANHASVRTTLRYVRSREVRKKHDNQIHMAQKDLVCWIHGKRSLASLKKKVSAPRKQLQALVRGDYATVFGFDCRDPFAGIAAHSKKGKLCESFLGCFSCPNAVLFVDAPTCMKLQLARRHLLDSKSNMHPDRWKEVYEPLLNIIELDLLPRFGEKIQARAAGLASPVGILPALR